MRRRRVPTSYLRDCYGNRLDVVEYATTALAEMTRKQMSSGASIVLG